MNNDVKTIFCNLTSTVIAELIKNAKNSICYAAPSIQIEPAKAIVELIDSTEFLIEMITISIDFDERTFRMGYGDFEAIKLLREKGVVLNNVKGIRQGLLIIDDEGYSFTPTPLYLETENHDVVNAMRLSFEQIQEALARLSPAAKAIAVAQAITAEEKKRISNLPLEIDSIEVNSESFSVVDKSLEQIPPAKFDIARQVRVFESYFQYVELSLTGAAIQRQKISIPKEIQKVGQSKELENRLTTSFEFIAKDSGFSSKSLEDELNEIRNNFSPSLGKKYGRVVLKPNKQALLDKLDELEKNLKTHQDKIKSGLQECIDNSRKQIIEYYKPIIMKSPPDSLRGRIVGEPDEKTVEEWIEMELERVFPKADKIVDEMKIEKTFKDITFETLNQSEFMEAIKAKFPKYWDKICNEFKAVGEKNDDAIILSSLKN
jgi:hypothetical protein